MRLARLQATGGLITTPPQELDVCPVLSHIAGRRSGMSTVYDGTASFGGVRLATGSHAKSRQGTPPSKPRACTEILNWLAIPHRTSEEMRNREPRPNPEDMSAESTLEMLMCDKLGQEAPQPSHATLLCQALRSSRLARQRSFLRPHCPICMQRQETGL